MALIYLQKNYPAITYPPKHARPGRAARAVIWLTRAAGRQLTAIAIGWAERGARWQLAGCANRNPVQAQPILAAALADLRGGTGWLM